MFQGTSREPVFWYLLWHDLPNLSVGQVGEQSRDTPAHEAALTVSKQGDDHSPILEFFRHLRNALSHGTNDLFDEPAARLLTLA